MQGRSEEEGPSGKDVELHVQRTVQVMLVTISACRTVGRRIVHTRHQHRLRSSLSHARIAQWIPYAQATRRALSHLLRAFMKKYVRATL